MAMTITNLTNQDYWFGPLHLPAGNGQTLIVDDTSDTSLYLTDDSVADAINTLYAATPQKITITGAAGPFPRATGVPELLHGDGSPEGVVYAGQGSVYLRRDNSGGTQLYQKTTGIHLNTGWLGISGSIINPSGTIQMWGGIAAPTGYLLCDGSAVSRTTYADLFGAISTSFGAGDGSTTFNVPDMQGRAPVGVGPNATVSTVGASDGVTAASRRGTKHRHTPHTHTEDTRTVENTGSSDPSGANGGFPNIHTGTTLTTSSTDGGSGVSTDPLDGGAYLVLNYIIKT